jgi:DNA-binding GntR family transcriptional regulator
MIKGMIKLSKNNNLDDIVYEKLKEAIILNKFPPNYKIVESEIARKMNVSRTPVHIAIKLLEKDGLLTLIRNKGAVVKHITYKDIKDAFALRVELERITVKLAINKINEKHIKILEEYIKQEEEAYKSNNRHKAYLLASKFHKKIAEISGNNFLFRNVNDIVDKTDYFDIFFIIDDPELNKKYDSPIEHSNILNALKSKQINRAVQLMEDNIKNTEKKLPNLLSYFNSNYIDEFLKLDI